MALKRQELNVAQGIRQENIAREDMELRARDVKEREQLDAAEEKERLQREEQQKKSERLRKASKKLEKILPKMTTDGLEIPMYFKTVENYFHKFKVEDDLKIALLLPSMNEKARKVITRLNATQRENYEEVKKQVLREFKMTPQAYRMQFMESMKEATESWMQYASRLKTILSYYMEGRSVVTIEKMTQLIVSDRMKDTMPYKLKEYILSKEGEEWLEPRILAKAADVYVSNVSEQMVNFKHKSSSSGNHNGNKPVTGSDNWKTSDHGAGKNVNERSVKSENKQVYQNHKSEQGNWRSNPSNSRMPLKCYLWRTTFSEKLYERKYKTSSSGSCG